MARSVSVARLFFDIEANTKGLDGQLSQAEKSLGRTANFIDKNVGAALGAAGVALIGFGISATTMAGEVDAAFRKVANAAQLPIDDLEALKAAGADLATEFGISQGEIARVMEDVARTGIKTSEELIAASRAAVRAQRATGEEFSTIIGVIDSAMDNFGVTADQVDASLAKLLATAKGRVSLADLGEVLEKIGPTAKTAGVDLETMAAAIVTILPTAKSTRDAVSQLDRTLEQLGVQGLQSLADQSRVATDGVADLQAQIDFANGTLENQAKIIREQLNAEMIRLGNVALPLVLKGMQFLSDLLGGVNTKVQRFIDLVGDTKGTDQQQEAVSKLGKSLVDLTGALDLVDPKFAKAAEGIDNFAAVNSELSNSIRKLKDQDLKLLEDGLVAAAESGKLTSKQMLSVAESLGKINAEQLRRKPIITPEENRELGQTVSRLDQIKALAAGGASIDDIIAKLGTLSAVEEKAARDAIKGAKDRAKAHADAAKVVDQAAEKHAAAMRKIRDITVETSLTLTDDLMLAIENLSNELLDAGVSAEALAEGLKPLQAELRLVSTLERLKLPDILRKSADALTDFDLTRLRQARTVLQGILFDAKAGTKPYVEIKEEIKRVTDKIVEAENGALLKTQDNIFKTKEWRDWVEKTYESVKKIPPPLDDSKQKIFEMTGRLVSVAQGALGVATAFGVVKGETAAVLANIIATGENIAKFAASGFTDPAALIGAIGSLAGVIGGLFGDSPETKARKALLEENTQALRALTDVQGDILRISQPGAQLQSAEDALRNTLEILNKNPLASPILTLTKELAKVGLSLGEFEEIASSLGFNLRNAETGKIDPQALRLFFEGLRAADVGFGSTFQGQMDRITTEIQAGLLKPSQELAAVVDLLTRGPLASPAITDALKNIDIFQNPEAAVEALQGVIEKFATGQLTKGDLGGLSGEEFLDTILKIIGFLQDDAADERLGSSRDPFDADDLDDSPITLDDLPSEKPRVLPTDAAEAQAETLDALLGASREAAATQADILTTQVDLTTSLLGATETSNAHLQAIESLLASLAGVRPVTPPSLPERVLAGAAATVGQSNVAVALGGVNVTVQVAPGTDAAEQGRIAGETAVATIDRGLSDPFFLEKLRRGIVT